MSLAETLKQIKQESKERLPEKVQEVVANATRELEESGLPEAALGSGDSVPSFRLENQDGEEVTSAELLQHEALVLAFFRGRW